MSSPTPAVTPSPPSTEEQASGVREGATSADGDAAAAVNAEAPCRHWPLATLALAALQLHLHWQATYRPDQSRCASLGTILEDGHWSRVVSAAFHHEDRWQLAMNVSSFLWKGSRLEMSIGTPLFSVAMAKLVLLVGVTNTLLNLVAGLVLNTDEYDTVCMYTFSGVLIALKVINERRSNFTTFRWGTVEVELPPPRISWLEVIALHVAASKNLTTMFSGLLVGFIFAEGIVSPRQRAAAGPFFKAPFLPVTYGIMGALLATHYFWPGMDPCVSFRAVFEHGRWRQLLLPSLYTFSSYHLVYIVFSLISLGRQMEPRYGHDNFLMLVLFVTLCVNSAHCLITWILSRHSIKLLEPLLPPSLRDTCFSGFTGALLTLKMLLYKERPEADYDFASFQMAVPHWFGLITEMAHLYMYTARTWLLGHAAGIAVGLMLTHVPGLRPSDLARRRPS